MTQLSQAVCESIDYEAFGQPNVSTDTCATNHMFTGKEYDEETGLDYFGARHYSWQLGRFMRPDWATKPIDVPYANFGNPQSLNLCAYVKNNPLSDTDPDGHISQEAVCQDAVTQCNPFAQNSKNQAQAHNQQGVAATPTYKTRDEAAKAAEKAALNATDKSGRKYEYGGWILKTKDGQYTYAIPVTFKDPGHFYRPFPKVYQASRIIIRIRIATGQKGRDSQQAMSNTPTIITAQFTRRTHTRGTCIALRPAFRSTNQMNGAVVS